MVYQPDGPRQELVRRKAEAWANALIDTGPRNPLLRFRNTKTTTLDLAACPPSALVSVLEGRKTGLRTLFPNNSDRHKAAARARSLSRKIREFAEEQGIDVGRLAQGLVTTGPQPDANRNSVPPLRAPVLLRPVEVTPRTTTESEFALQVVGEPELNPVLIHALRQEHGAALDHDRLAAEISKRLAETPDPQDHPLVAFSALDDAARGFGVRLGFDAATVVGLFNYEKLPMVRDLQSATGLLAESDVIAALAGDKDAVEALRSALPDSAQLAIDRVNPREEFLVHDADSSQHQAIHVALSGRHILIEGPPGTGKSQTIANLIAWAAAKGKRVLFVAEKQAAIEAVVERLGQVGLDDLVLDLHRSHSGRRHFVDQLAARLKGSAHDGAVEAGHVHQRLVQHRRHLVATAAELHQPHEPWGISPYQVREEILRIGRDHASQSPLGDRRLLDLTGQAIADLQHDISLFVSLGGLRLLRGESPWSSAVVRDEEEVRAVWSQLDALTATTLRTSGDGLRKLLGRLGLPVPDDLAGCEAVLSLLDQVSASVDSFGPEVFSADLDRWLLATAPRSVRARVPERLGWSRRRALLKQVRAMSRRGLRRKADLHAALVEVDRQREEWRRLGGQAAPAKAAGLKTVMDDYRVLRRQLTAVAMCARMEDVERTPTADVEERLTDLRNDRETLFNLPRLTELRTRFEKLGLAMLLDEIAAGGDGAERAGLRFRLFWLRHLDDELTLRCRTLREFSVDRQDRAAADFRTADTEHRRLAAALLRHRVAVAAAQARDDFPDQAAMVRKEASKKSRHKTIRTCVEEAPDVLLSLWPCWAMSPLVVSRTLPPRRLFDLVVFDEASQIQPHEAVTSIMRGDQLVVAGDDRQLPPSTWFDRALVHDEGEGDTQEDDGADLSDFESILTGLRPIIPHGYRLRWHYRSADERLIAFSNREVYDNDLVTFPGAHTESPLTLEVVDGVVSPGQSGSSPEEVRRVVQLVLDHAEHRPQESLGVITLGEKHRARLEYALRQARQDRRDLDHFFGDDAEDPHSGPNRRFFIKNIETVQGDERDAIILSLGVGRRADGRVARTGFGPLNRQGGERRLNVAITRARRRMTVVSCFGSAALEPSEAVTGTELLRRYLEMIERQSAPDDVGRLTTHPLNGFEEDIRRRLEAAGIRVYPQWGFSGYRIDFALAHPNEPGRMVLAVEADGDRYHRSASARDRDRLRQEHLMRLGWRFHRVWSSAWYADPEGEASRIVDAWQRATADHDRRVAAAPSGSTGEPRRADGDRGHPPDPGPAPDGGPGGGATRVAAPPSQVRASRPDVPQGLPTAKYTDKDLIDLCLWLIGDGEVRDRHHRVDQALRELGFKKRGPRIVARLEEALDIAQHYVKAREN
ncbi:AAA domain-containing protein [Streptomonospora nanhaiensis]|uniref:AAA domain-containing protein n=1 Tax=Streptomonospora nanhaiensis TaxID=1323731 RepID=UPI001C997564|nr:AAA domain-containing protein [Streptomonospora nanhaiensis]MBX9387548.1 DUF4011 domain-containing protein [Streptomonospora nanhaiensis]